MEHGCQTWRDKPLNKKTLGYIQGPFSRLLTLIYALPPLQPMPDLQITTPMLPPSMMPHSGTLPILPKLPLSTMPKLPHWPTQLPSYNFNSRPAPMPLPEPIMAVKLCLAISYHNIATYRYQYSNSLLQITALTAGHTEHVLVPITPAPFDATQPGPSTCSN